MGSIGIIGGSDGPTAIFVTATAPSLLTILAVIAAAAVVLVVTAVILHRR